MASGADYTEPEDGGDQKRRPKAARIAGSLLALAVCVTVGFCLGLLFPNDRSFELCELRVKQELSDIAEVSGRRISNTEIELSFTSGISRERSPGTARCEFSKTAAEDGSAVNRIVINGRDMSSNAH